MALVRVYCGLATAGLASRLTAAVVDDSGRLLDLRDLGDSPAGYAELGALLAQRGGMTTPVAADRGDHLVAQLLAAANRPIAIVDAESVADFAERFADDESPDERESTAGHRRAIGLARALQAGAVSAVARTPAWDLDEFKPVLAAHAAVMTGRQAAAAALREVLRELYPAALRAYPDPAELLPLRILDALPEPGLLTTSPSSRSRDAALVAELSATGVADPGTAVAAITALRVAVQESPRRSSLRMLGPVVAETIRQATAAVRACDAASAALVASLVQRLDATGPSAPAQPPYLVPVTPVPRRPAGPAAAVPQNRVAPRERTPSAAAAGVSSAGAVAPSAPLGAAAVHQPPLPSPGWNGAGYPPDIPAPRPAPGFPAPGFPAPGFPAPGFPAPGFPAPGSREDWPLVPSGDDDLAVARPPGMSFGLESPTEPRPVEQLSPALVFSPAPVSPGRVPPPWLAEDMPPEPPALRLVDSDPGRTRPMGDPLTDPLPADPFEGMRFAPPVLRVIDGQGAGKATRSAAAERDGDLLIFSQTRSAWFTQIDEAKLADDDTATWGRLSDEGWHAAEQLARPTVGADTHAGLPRRVPQANLVPGAPLPVQRQLRIVRDPERIAAHTTGYFRGWRRGQEIGGFAVGQRDRAAWEFNRDQRARTDHTVDQRARLS